jgi:hypothetical protein
MHVAIATYGLMSAAVWRYSTRVDNAEPGMTRIVKWTPNFGPVGKVVRKSLLEPKRSRKHEEYTYQAHAGVQGEGRPRSRA